jgi:hypothetical protein
MFGFLLGIVVALFCYLTHLKMEWNIRGWAMTKFALLLGIWSGDSNMLG